MVFIQSILLAFGLAMDAFSVSVCKGLSMKKINIKNTLIIALFFGGFQALMPLIGWFLGTRFEKYIVEFDHWIAFALLSVIGLKMLYDAFKGGDTDDTELTEKLNLKELTLLAVATSIDALAVGVTLAFVNADILSSVLTIGIITFLLSAIGVFAGCKFGGKYQKGAEITGGVVLVLIGVKILFEDLGIINF